MRGVLRWLGYGAASLIALSCIGVVLTWAPDRSVESLKPRWAAPPSTFIAVEGMQVHVRDVGPRGDPMPIVLVHGTSASLHTWNGWVAALEGTRRVITMDLPAFGLTGPAADGDYSAARYARFVLALLDQLGVNQMVLAGNSLGGEVAWHAALAAPRRVTRLILVDAGGFPIAATSVPIGFRIARLPVLGRAAEYVLPRALVEASVRNVYGDPARVSAELVDRYFELNLRAGNRRALAARFAQISRDDPSGRLRMIAMPTLILWGGRDRLLLPADGAKFARAIPGSRLVMFDDLGHVPHEEDAARTVAEVRRFIAP